MLYDWVEIFLVRVIIFEDFLSSFPFINYENSNTDFYHKLIYIYLHSTTKLFLKTKPSTDLNENM